MNTSQTKLLGILLILVAVALGVMGARHPNRPAQFHATATVKVERDKIDLPALGKEAPAGMDSTIFIQTEIELLQSDIPLNQVVEKLDLNQVWGKRYSDGQTLKQSETLHILKKRLQLRADPGDTRITINVASDEAGEAAEIANAVAQAYCDYRAEYRRRLAQNALAELSVKFKANEEKIAVAQRKVEQAAQELDPGLRDPAAPAGPTESEQLLALRSRFAASVLRYAAQSNQFVIYSATSGHDEEIAKQLELKADKTRAEMVATEATINDQIRKLDSLRIYQAAQQELDELNLLFAPLKKTVEELQHDLSPQERAPAEIVERATIPTHAAEPAGTPGWVFLASGGFALVLGLALLLLAGKSVTRA